MIQSYRRPPSAVSPIAVRPSCGGEPARETIGFRQINIRRRRFSLPCFCVVDDSLQFTCVVLESNQFRTEKIQQFRVGTGLSSRRSFTGSITPPRMHASHSRLTMFS